MRPPYLLILALCGAAVAFGCPDAKDSAPGKTCLKAYEKCVLPSGVLGVCDQVACPQGASEPCLVCRSQH